MLRYGIIREKDPREIVLLRGKGCFYKKCAFCDYHLDACSDDDANVALNRDVLKQVTGEYGNLEVINSGSFHELGEKTLALIRETVREKGIGVVHFEAHYLVRNLIPGLREFFAGTELKLRIGIESFDEELREGYLRKGMPGVGVEEIASFFQEANFLVGVKGQTAEMMLRDVKLGLRYFQRININVMCDNTTPVKPDQGVIDVFMREIYPLYKDDARVDILIHNTDFTVGTPT